MEKENKTYCVYMHKNKINNKIYFGITSNIPESRWNNGKGYQYNSHFYYSIEKYGWDNFEHIILHKNLSKSEAENLEIQLIKQYDTINQEKGYNIQKGGKLNGSKTVYQYDRKTGVFLKEWENTVSIEKELGIQNADISAVCLGKFKTIHGYYFSYKFYGDKLDKDILKLINTNDCKVKVDKYSLDGKFLETYDTIVQAAKSNNIKCCSNISSCIKERHNTCGGFIWKKHIDGVDRPNDIEVSLTKEINNKEIYMYNRYTGSFIKKWSSATAASRELNINQSNISASARKKYNYTNDYIFRFACDYPYGASLPQEELIIKTNQGNPIKIYQFNKTTGKLINEYDSITEAAKQIDGSTTNICKCLKKQTKTAYGYIWRYEPYDIVGEELLQINNHKKLKKVSKYSIEGDYIETYDSMIEAASENNTTSSSIYCNINGMYSHAGGFHWKYA